MSGPFSERSSLKTRVFGGFSATIAHSLNVLYRREQSPFHFLFSPKGFRRVFSLVLFFGVWQFFCTIKFNFFINFTLIPSPLEVLGSTIEFFSNNPMLHIWASAARVLSGFAIAAVVGISLGIFIGWFQQIEDLIFPPLELLRPIPAVAWIPLAILMFPSSESGMIYITFIGAFFPILISTIRGVENTDLLLLRVGQCLGAKQWHLFKDIVVPGAMPSIASGLVIGMGNAWFCLVTAEILAGRYGIGYLTWESYVTSNYPPIVMGMLLIGLMGAFSTYAVDKLTRLLMPWRVTKKQSP
ncbi:MAG: ABC transporter permease [Pelatocladus maniniholoensis HA4357-MV3]|jgi:NitT/TauT family transport system permease protein|uniref:ABC transporter permease n=1 Tax=Pelatocladus maniniholoensis HA4357-MV3 TaxID=1117104 RepID=A0A9E3HC01_9NOST|nr:ABC transporter permease [Pelatocladus maniniholoensis HA4357-MV3]BAZ70739.1 ABC transporter permease protein [Fischerella sp. NIES-4106]